MSKRHQNRSKMQDEKNVSAKNFLEEEGINESTLLNLEGEAQKDLNETVTSISEWVKKYGKELSPTQLRNVYHKLKSDKKYKTHSGLALFRPKLAYTMARQRDDNAKDMLLFVDKLIQEVDSPETHEGFMTFMEAFVAYHKYHHGDKNKNS